MDKTLEQLIELYIFGCMHEGIIRDAEMEMIPNDYFPDIVVMMMNEDAAGRLTSGLIGYVLALGYNIHNMEVQVPRSVSIACLELLRPFAAADRPDLLEVIHRCDRANGKYLTGQDIEESGADNVTQLH